MIALARITDSRVANTIATSMRGGFHTLQLYRADTLGALSAIQMPLATHGGSTVYTEIADF